MSTTKVTTLSGSTYEFDRDFEHVRRVESTHGLRRDGEWMECSITEIRIGKPMVMFLNLREDGILTARTTSAVTEISNV